MSGQERTQFGQATQCPHWPACRPQPVFLLEAIGPLYWCGQGLDSLSFSKNVNQAVRFARREDAEAVRQLLNTDTRTLCHSVEHMWG